MTWLRTWYWTWRIKWAFWRAKRAGRVRPNAREVRVVARGFRELVFAPGTVYLRRVDAADVHPSDFTQGRS